MISVCLTYGELMTQPFAAAVNDTTIGDRHLRRKTMKHAMLNAVWMTLASSVQRLLPFLVIPLLTRRLGHDAFGDYMLAVALSAIVTQIVEFGFNLTATRKAAEICERGEDATPVLAEVIGGRAVIATAVLLGLFVVRHFHPLVVEDPWLFWSSVLLGVAIGGDFRCMFYGRQSVGYLTVYAVAYSILTALVIVVLVWARNDLWLAFAAPMLVALAFSAVSLRLLNPKWRTMTFQPSDVLAALKDSWHSFLQRGLGQISSNISPLIVGLFAPVAAVGYFALAERLLRQAALFVLNPAQSIFMPYVASQRLDNPRLATRNFLLICGLLLAGSVAASGAAFAMAPALAQLFLAEATPASVAPLQILSGSPPLLVVNQFAFPLWFFLLGKQHINSVISVGYALGFAAAIFIGASYAGHIGACAAIILSQIALMLVYISCAHVLNIAPWQRNLSAQ